MRAIVQDRYGPPEVLRIEDVPRPEPGDDEVLIRVRASTVTQTDTHARAATPFFWRFFAGFRRPRIRTLGIELAGEIEAVGATVREFRVGDRVFGGPRWFGAHAELICLPESGLLAPMPDGLGFDQAAALSDGPSQALAALRAADVRAGQRIVIYGASGSLGTAAVQLAHHLGAHVTAVCSAKNVALVRSLGADETVDYQTEDFTRNGRTYDAIIDAVGKYSFLRCRHSLKRGGSFIGTDGGRFLLETVTLMLVTRFAGSRRVKGVISHRSREDLLLLKSLAESGEYRPVIDRRYPMEQVADAHRYVETWQKTGNVVLMVAP